MSDVEQSAAGGQALGPDAPMRVVHGIPRDLLELDVLEAALRRAPEGRAVVQVADTGPLRPLSPGRTTLERPLAAELARRRLQVSLEQIDDWAPEYAAVRDAALTAVGLLDRPDRLVTTTAVRVFSAGADLAMHPDATHLIDGLVAGHAIWRFAPPDALSQDDHEWLLRGRQFWQSGPVTPSLVIDVTDGAGVIAPPRWPHWIEHPGPGPAVHVEVEFWTAGAIRDRKVHDVNWALRRVGLDPAPPGRRPGRDRLKCRLFDVASRMTGKGGIYRGL